MKDDKKRQPISKESPEEALSQEKAPDFEYTPEVDRAHRPETAEGGEREPSSEEEIETTREQFTANRPAKDTDDEEDKLKALKEADKLRDMEHEGRKIEHLMHLAEKKGVGFAVEVAKKTNDACLLDLLHDKIIEKGLNKDL